MVLPATTLWPRRVCRRSAQLKCLSTFSRGRSGNRRLTEALGRLPPTEEQRESFRGVATSFAPTSLPLVPLSLSVRRLARTHKNTAAAEVLQRTTCCAFTLSACGGRMEFCFLFQACNRINLVHFILHAADFTFVHQRSSEAVGMRLNKVWVRRPP